MHVTQTYTDSKAGFSLGTFKKKKKKDSIIISLKLNTLSSHTQAHLHTYCSASEREAHTF